VETAAVFWHGKHTGRHL